jgi:hypothetical protein
MTENDNEEGSSFCLSDIEEHIKNQKKETHQEKVAKHYQTLDCHKSLFFFDKTNPIRHICF